MLVPDDNINTQSRSSHTTPLSTEEAALKPIRVGQPSSQALPEIQVNNRPLRHITTDCLDALHLAYEAKPEIFVRGSLCRVNTDERGRANIAPIGVDQLRGCLARSANFVNKQTSVNNKGEKVTRCTQVSPPMDAVKDILARSYRDWKFPILSGIVHSPVLRSDGTILDTRGYDQSLELVYAPPRGFKLPSIPPKPTKDDLQRAVATVDDILYDFDFADAASRANVFALFLSPLLRRLIDGPLPLALVNAPIMGSGKSLLAEIQSIIATGQRAAMKPAPPARTPRNNYSDEEWRKMLTAAFLAGDPIITFDNVEGELNNSSLALALTATIWKDRILGRSEQVVIEQRSVIVATGNNIQLGGDLGRRSYWIHLEPKSSEPWRRSDFRHPKLLRYVADNREELLAALLTLGVGWIEGGSKPGSTSIGSYEEFCDIIGGVLQHAGIEGFLANMDESRERANPSEDQWAEFLWALASTSNFVHGFSARQAAEELRTGEKLKLILPDEIAEDCSDGAALENLARTLGNAFSRRIGRRYDVNGIRVEQEGKDRTGVAKWIIRVG